MGRRKRKHRYQDAALEQTRLSQAEGKLEPGKVYIMDVRHDDWCDLLSGKGTCNCNPEVCEPKRISYPEDN